MYKNKKIQFLVAVLLALFIGVGVFTFYAVKNSKPTPPQLHTAGLFQGLTKAVDNSVTFTDAEIADYKECTSQKVAFYGGKFNAIYLTEDTKISDLVKKIIPTKDLKFDVAYYATKETHFGKSLTEGFYTLGETWTNVTKMSDDFMIPKYRGVIFASSIDGKFCDDENTIKTENHFLIPSVEVPSLTNVDKGWVFIPTTKKVSDQIAKNDLIGKLSVVYSLESLFDKFEEVKSQNYEVPSNSTSFLWAYVDKNLPAANGGGDVPPVNDPEDDKTTVIFNVLDGGDSIKEASTGEEQTLLKFTVFTEKEFQVPKIYISEKENDADITHIDNFHFYAGENPVSTSYSNNSEGSKPRKKMVFGTPLTVTNGTTYTLTGSFTEDNAEGKTHRLGIEAPLDFLPNENFTVEYLKPENNFPLWGGNYEITSGSDNGEGTGPDGPGEGSGEDSGDGTGDGAGDGSGAGSGAGSSDDGNGNGNDSTWEINIPEINAGDFVEFDGGPGSLQGLYMIAEAVDFSGYTNPKYQIEMRNDKYILSKTIAKSDLEYGELFADFIKQGDEILLPLTPVDSGEPESSNGKIYNGTYNVKISAEAIDANGAKQTLGESVTFPITVTKQGADPNPPVASPKGLAVTKADGYQIDVKWNAVDWEGHTPSHYAIKVFDINKKIHNDDSYYSISIFKDEENDNDFFTKEPGGEINFSFNEVLSANDATYYQLADDTEYELQVSANWNEGNSIPSSYYSEKVEVNMEKLDISMEMGSDDASEIIPGKKHQLLKTITLNSNVEDIEDKIEDFKFENGDDVIDVDTFEIKKLPTGELQLYADVNSFDDLNCGDTYPECQLVLTKIILKNGKEFDNGGTLYVPMKFSAYRPIVTISRDSQELEIPGSPIVLLEGQTSQQTMLTFKSDRNVTLKKVKLIQVISLYLNDFEYYDSINLMIKIGSNDFANAPNNKHNFYLPLSGIDILNGVDNALRFKVFVGNIPQFFSPTLLFCLQEYPMEFDESVVFEWNIDSYDENQSQAPNIYNNPKVDKAILGGIQAEFCSVMYDIE